MNSLSLATLELSDHLKVGRRRNVHACSYPRLTPGITCRGHNLETTRANDERRADSGRVHAVVGRDLWFIVPVYAPRTHEAVSLITPCRPRLSARRRGAAWYAAPAMRRRL
jgi:hypothetical protein